MKLPNADVAVAAQEKIRDYLLNAAHPDNGGKAAFFLALGFAREDWNALAIAFRELAQTTQVSAQLESTHGQKYTVDGRIQSPGGRSSVVRTIWIIDHGENIPRLVTAYPHEE
ncbi:MAG TPA: hypothetical protein VIL63_05665 [Terriglobales bacterium]